jgi:hypothetical protein
MHIISQLNFHCDPILKLRDSLTPVFNYGLIVDHNEDNIFNLMYYYIVLDLFCY